MGFFDIMGILFGAIIEIMKNPIPVGTFTTSIWDMMLFSLAAGAIITIIWRFFDG